MRIRRALGLALIFLTTTAAGVQELNLAGTEAYHRGDFAAAERLYRQALRQSPRDAVLHYHLGVALTRLSRWREAAAAFQSALRLQPSPEVESAAREALRGLEPLLSARPREEADLIRLTRLGGVWVAEVLVNGRYPARFLVDTGAAICVISPQLADRAGLRPHPDATSMTLLTLSGQTTGQVVTIPALRVGGVEAHDVQAVVHVTGEIFDGILGNTFLSRYSATLDPRRGLLNLESR